MKLTFEGVACPKRDALCLPTEDELDGRWSYGTCFRCGTKLPPLRLTDECYAVIMAKRKVMSLTVSVT